MSEIEDEKIRQVEEALDGFRYLGLNELLQKDDIICYDGINGFFYGRVTYAKRKIQSISG